MDEPGTDCGLDAAAIRLLAELIDARETDRRTTLERLAGEKPALHMRVMRLLSTADAAANSRLVREHMAMVPTVAGIASTLTNGAILGNYRLLRELGRGGMAIVWLAERTDGLFKRPAALKVPLFTLASTVEHERFRRERDVLASLNHPGIARLLDAGVVESGQPFIVLEYVDGQQFDVACNDRHFGMRERLRMFMQVLEAVDHAHKHLVIHRDLKPSNVLIDTEERVRLLDFGVAKLLDESALGADRTSLTQIAGCALTPRYAAPEQLDNGAISTATDIYSLGVMLFELLCGTSPYGSGPSSSIQWIRAVSETDPARPSQTATDSFASDCAGSASPARWRSALQGDLDNIVLKALRKVPSERYGSVERFMDDVQRYLDHRPVAARRPSMAHQVKLFVRRHVGASVAGALGGAAALALGGVAAYQYQQGEAERQRTEIVRDFMFDLVNDAETDEQQAGTEPTGRQMVAAAVHRARERFAEQPRLRGELLAELGRMQGRLADDASSAPLLLEAVDVLSKNAPGGDPPLNKARAYLASVQLEKGQPDKAAEMANAALALCTQGRACAKARYYASAVLSRIELSRGNAIVALTHMERGVKECEAGFGLNDSETALAVLSFAITARQAGQLETARTSLDRAIAMSRGLKLRLSDRIAMERIRAVLSMDLGDYIDARSRFEAALAQARMSGDRAELLRNLATVHVALGEAGAARDAADAAIRTGSQQGVEALLAHQAHARAMSLLGEGIEASEEMLKVIAGLRGAGFSDQAMEVMRARRFHAETEIRSGQLERGLAHLRDLAREQSPVKVGQEVEFAQTLDLLGSALRHSSMVEEAIEVHREAAVLLAQKLSADHIYRHRNAIYTRAAALILDPATEEAAAFSSQALRYASRFPEGSYWRGVIDGRLSKDVCVQAGGTPCNFFL